MKHIQLILLLGGACLSLNSQAQSFGDFLKNSAVNAARAAVSGNVDRAVTGAIDRAFSGAPEQDQSQAADTAAAAGAPISAIPAAASSAFAAPAPQAAAAPALAAGCKKRLKEDNLLLGARPESFEPAGLWPENAACAVHSFRDFEFKQAREAKHAFREASKIRCHGCEGGYAFDAWGGHGLIKKGGDYSAEFAKLLVALKQGQSVGWKGNKYHVSITKVGEHPIGDTPCNQFHYVLKDGGKQVAQYDGMYCEYARPYISKPTWNEVV
ncbi:hypothetical protein [Massilia sp. DD77]|uniref:hypothetical protein n=1 Tax=Massilia sp. DD77 TaxID=3109349 RepID=UPI002FFF5DEC